MIDIKELFKAGVHFGHRTSRWSPHMKPYIWGAKNKVHLIDVAKTAVLLDRAGAFLKEVASQGGSLLWIGTKKAARDIIKKTAQKFDQPFVINRWVGGTLSNYNEIKKAITRYLHLQDAIKKSTSHYSKKELSVLNKEIARLEKNVGGIINLDYPPDAVITIDAKKENAAVHEALRLGIPVISLVDTNTNPTGINFVIPSNDDSPRAIECVIGYLCTYIEEGRKLFAEKEKEEKEEKVAATTPTKPEPTKEQKAAEKEVTPAEEKAKEAPEEKTAKKVEPKEKTKAATKKPSEEKAPAKPKAAKSSTREKAVTEGKAAEKAPEKTTTKKPAAQPKTKETTPKKEATSKEATSKEAS